MDAPQHKSVEAQTAACIVHSGPYTDIGSVYHSLYAWAKENGVERTGMPFTVFLASPTDLDWQSGRFEVCLPVPPGTEGTDAITINDFPAMTVLSATVKGPYSELPAHYSEILAWATWENITLTGQPREIYHVHPAADGSGDVAEFVTEIQFPISGD
jgi:effector-binding domain-containing protein